ncbi:MAG: hypothetical protein R3Y24_15500 [Eubacteriales bacterium]
MEELWKKANEWLNSYGGLISTISFFVSIFIYVKTGQIKNSIKSLLNHDKYLKQKKKAQNKLQGMLDSIEKDDVFDNKILGEINREISALDHYAIFFDKKMKTNIKGIKKVINCKYQDIDKQDITIKLNKILEDLDINDVYVG